MTTTAIIGSAVIGAGTSLIAGDKASDAASAAAGVQAQQGAQIRSDLGPFREVGTAALFELAALQGLPVNFPATGIGLDGDGPVIDETGAPVADPRGGGFRDDFLRIPPGEDPIAVLPLSGREAGPRRLSRFRG